MNCNLCDDTQQSVPRLKQYIKPGDIYSLDITKFVDLQTNSVDFQSNVDYVELPGYSKDVKSLKFEEVDFNPIETKYGNGSFFILQNDQRTILKISQKSLQMEDFILNEYLQENQTLKCNDLMMQENYLWILCKDEAIIHQDEILYKIITVDYLMNQILTDVQFYSRILSNPKFKLRSLKDDQIKMILFDKQIQKDIKHQPKQFIDEINFSIIKQKENQEDKIYKDEISKLQIESIKINLNDLIGELLDKKNSNYKVLNIMIDQTTNNAFIVVQEQDHKGKNVYQCVLNQNKNSCKKFIDQKVVHFFYKNQNYLFIDESLTLKFCSLNYDQSSTCREGAMKKNWKIISVNLEYNRGLIAVEDDKNYFVFINDYSTGYFNWYKDDLNGVKKLQLFQSDILDGSHHIYYMMKFKQNHCDLQNLTFNKYIIIDSKNIKKNEQIEIHLSNIKILDIEIILWNGQSLINYLEQDKVYVIPDENQLYSFKLPWIAQAPQFLTNEIQLVEYFNQIQMKISGKTKQESKFLLQNSVMIEHNNRLYAFQENSVNIFMIAEIDLNYQMMLYQEQYIEYDLLKDDQLRNIEKHGSIVLFNDFEENKISVYSLDQNTLNTYSFQHEQDLQKCLINTDFFICSNKNEDQNSNWINLYKFNEENEIILDEDNTQKLNQKANQFIQESINFETFDKILISDFDLDSCNDEKFVVVFNLYTQNKQQPLLAEIKIKKHTNGHITYLFKQIFKNDLNAGDVTFDDKIYLYNGQTIVVQEEPTFNVIIQKNQSFTQLPFLEASSVMTHRVSKQRGLLAVLYRSSFNQQNYLAVYQLTSDAALQLAVIENIQQLEFDQDMYITITSLSNKQVLINVLQQQDNQIKLSYVFNQTGPILFTKELSNEITINEQGINIESQVDLKLMLSDFNYVEDNVLRVHKFEDTLYNLKQFVEIEGNVNNIQVMQPEQIQINSKNISISNSIEQFHMLDYSFLHRYCTRCSLNDSFVISEYQDSNGEYYLQNFDSLESMQIGINNCIDFDYDLANEIFLCLKHQPNKISMSTYFYTKNTQYKEEDLNQIEVPFDSVSLKMVYSTLTNQVFKLENNQKNKVTFIAINAANKTQLKITIDGKQLQADMLFVQSNFSIVESTASQLLLHTLIYDQRANKLYINSADLKTGKNLSFLNKIVNLNQYESQTFGLNCQEVDVNFECYLIGRLNIYKLDISKQIENGFNKLNWVVENKNTLKNALYDQTSDLNFQPEIVFNDKHVILTNKDSSLSLKRIIHYYKESIYADYVYEINELKTLMDIQIKERSQAETVVLLLKNELNQVEIQILKLNEDTMIKISQNNNKQLIENRQMKVNFMNGSNLIINFQVLNNVEFINNDSESFFQRHWFIVCMVLLLCLLAFFLLIVLLVLLRERKKINLRMAMLNEGNSNVPLTEI